jgi:hypothetical protein
MIARDEFLADGFKSVGFDVLAEEVVEHLVG